MDIYERQLDNGLILRRDNDGFHVTCFEKIPSSLNCSVMPGNAPWKSRT